MGTEGVQTKMPAATRKTLRVKRSTVGVPGVPYPAVDPIIAIAVALLIVWGAGTWFEAPGWIHILLTGGIFLLVWRIVTKGRPPIPPPK